MYSPQLIVAWLGSYQSQLTHFQVAIKEVDCIYLVNLLAVEVGQANMADQTLVHQLLHCPPRVSDGRVIIAYTTVRVFGEFFPTYIIHIQM